MNQLKKASREFLGISLHFAYPHILIRVWHLGLGTSRSRDFCQFFSSLGIGIGKKVSKKSLGIGIGKFGLGKSYKKSGEISKKLSVNSCQSYAKVSVSVSRPVTIFWESRYWYRRIWSRWNSLGIGIEILVSSHSDPHILISSYPHIRLLLLKETLWILWKMCRLYKTTFLIDILSKLSYLS